LSELKLTEEIRERVNSAHVRGNPMMVAHVTEDGLPGVSFRGSVQVSGDDQLTFWVRNPAGGLASALTHNPNLVLVYREANPAGATVPSASVMYFRGHDRVDATEAVRRAVYDAMPEHERNADRDYQGVPIIVDLQSVTGFLPGYALRMTRA
jgi:hypothetical protein